MEDDAHRNLRIALGTEQKCHFHFLSQLTISGGQKEKKYDTQDKVDTVKSGKSKHTLWI